MLKIIQKFWIPLSGFLIGIFVMIIILRFSSCNPSPKIVQSDTTYKHYVFSDSSYKDTLINRIQYAVKTVEVAKANQQRLDSFSTASKNYDSLLVQHSDLKEKYLSYYTNSDTIWLPNNGYVLLKDVISENKIISRKPTIDYKQLTVTVHDSTVQTINNIVAPNRQVYLGAELTGNQSNYVNGVNGIVMYKDRHDRVYQAKAGLFNYNNKAVPEYGLGVLFKLNFHKK